MGDQARLEMFQHTSRQAAYIGEVLWAVSAVTAIDTPSIKALLELAILNEQRQSITTGSATVRCTLDEAKELVKLPGSAT